MAALNTAYSALVLLVAVGGIAFVFYSTGADGDGEGDGTGTSRWIGWATALIVAAFLAVMVGDLVL